MTITYSALWTGIEFDMKCFHTVNAKNDLLKVALCNISLQVQCKLIILCLTVVLLILSILWSDLDEIFGVKRFSHSISLHSQTHTGSSAPSLTLFVTITYSALWTVMLVYEYSSLQCKLIILCLMVVLLILSILWSDLNEIFGVKRFSHSISLHSQTPIQGHLPHH